MIHRIKKPPFAKSSSFNVKKAKLENCSIIKIIDFFDIYNV